MSLKEARDVYFYSREVIPKGTDCSQWLAVRVSVMRELLECKYNLCSQFREKIGMFWSHSRGYIR